MTKRMEANAACRIEELPPVEPLTGRDLDDLVPAGAAPEFQKIIASSAAIRRDLHAHPELSLKERRTAARVVQALREIGCDEIREGVGCSSGVVARIRGGAGGRRRIVGLRADMDALPMQDSSGAPHASRHAGCAHACGHDGHVASLLAAAAVIAARRDRLAGDVVLVFQPGEEGHAGARLMLEDPAFGAFMPDEIYALHGAPDIPLGRFGMTRGWMQAAADRFEIVVSAPGGHGARPHLGADAIVTAGRLVEALQTIVSRDIDPLHPAVLSIGSISGGTADGVSVMPAAVVLTGTTRMTDPADRDRMERRMQEVCAGVAMTTGAKIDLRYVRMYPALVNDGECFAHALEAVRRSAGEAAADADFPPSMGAEDFAFFLERIPGAYVRLGLADSAHQAGLHQPAFDFNDKAIAHAAQFLSTLVEMRLSAE